MSFRLIQRSTKAFFINKHSWYNVSFSPKVTLEDGFPQVGSIQGRMQGRGDGGYIHFLFIFIGVALGSLDPSWSGTYDLWYRLKLTGKQEVLRYLSLAMV